MTAPVLDDLDLDLVAALQRSPRAPLNVLGEALDTSPSTVGRRLTRLVDEGIVRVVGQVDWSLLSDTHPHHVWINTRPGRARAVAVALTQVPGAQFVATTAGRADVHLTVHSPSRSETAHLLTGTIAGIEGVLSTHSELVLRAVTKADQWRLDRLGPEQRSLLVADSDAAGDVHPSANIASLTPAELVVTRLLHRDGRIPASDVGRETGMSRSTAHRVVQSLLSRGIVQPRVEIEPGLVGFPLEVAVQLAVKPGDTTAVAQWCAEQPSARYVSVVAGTWSVVHQGVFRNEDDLAQFLERDLAELPGITGWGVSVVLEVLQRYFLRRVDGRVIGAPISSIPEPATPGRVVRESVAGSAHRLAGCPPPNTP
ncbi:Lrp/AsnC family transcriptional regulator [Kineococcus sp. SYSU DK003]|uniref:Lrp/AsnC family transcriptional regulator n=1 Tax=Kineococcus sp. SYSU DK003 TaxID=3383124 RepID=UPI003D7DE371